MEIAGEDLFLADFLGKKALLRLEIKVGLDLFSLTAPNRILI